MPQSHRIMRHNNFEIVLVCLVRVRFLWMCVSYSVYFIERHITVVYNGRLLEHLFELSDFIVTYRFVFTADVVVTWYPYLLECKRNNMNNKIAR